MHHPRHDHDHDSLTATLSAADKTPAPPSRLAATFSRPAALIGGGIGLVALSIAATALVVRAPASTNVADGQRAAAIGVTDGGSAGRSSSGVVKLPDLPDETAADNKPAPVQAQRPARAPTRTAVAACTNCGVVAAVTPVRQKGEASGVGAVGGAVVGGLLGSAVGKGDGRKVATVLGAVGGGYAGNEIEKRHKATTVYQVRVRMNDGTTRTVTQSTAPAVGAKVKVEGSTLRARA
ncbi:MAG TPA: glycine zipper 2TM domain-containing protein [Burkholderiaceae bacterium]|nr:glycine zipper 2TM domain-containing protein [Burkholderiaceae bacterium]